MRAATRRPRTRDPVLDGGTLFRVVAEAVRPEPGWWLGRPDGPTVCEVFIARGAWRYQWNPRAQRWELAA